MTCLDGSNQAIATIRWIPRAALLAAVALSLAACELGGPAGRAAAQTPGHPMAPEGVTALGRIEPKNRIRRVAGPSRPSVVIAELLVDEGQWVDENQAIATLDTLAEDEAGVGRARAELDHARRTLERMTALRRHGIAAVNELENAQLAVDVAAAEVTRAAATLALDTVRAPVSGQVISIHARRGERVGADGIAEIAQNDEMYAVAEVYETDIARVHVGQTATVHSPALPSALTGTVERIGLKIGKLDLLDTDPVARTDARVVEVHVKLADARRAAALSNLQVEVTIAADATARNEPPAVPLVDGFGR